MSIFVAAPSVKFVAVRLPSSTSKEKVAKSFGQGRGCATAQVSDSWASLGKRAGPFFYDGQGQK